jgi:hypothetical protein
VASTVLPPTHPQVYPLSYPLTRSFAQLRCAHATLHDA